MTMKILDQINHPGDIRKVPHDQLPQLAEEIRQFLVESLSQTGGHLASNLGVVELTMALHLVFNPTQDRMIWDVGHQSYTHKILTGRREGFTNLRRLGGMSGFPKRAESSCDVFDTGHSSTSLSAGLGIVRARDLEGDTYSVLSIIGDGSATGGMVYEAMNNAATLKTNFIIVFNDNGMSISKNVGGLSSYLSDLRSSNGYTDLKKVTEDALRQIPFAGDWAVSRVKRTKDNLKTLLIPGAALLEPFGIQYFGPVDGSNIDQMVRIFESAKRVRGPVLVHVRTRKGRGYGPAERMPERFHGTGPFEIATGLPTKKKAKADWTDIFSTVMCKEGAKTPNLCAVTAAMAEGTGLRRFRGMYPDRFFDVGIAEEHAVTFCAGLAVGGMIPVFAVYSSFLQRGFDQLVHDVCLQNLHVVFAIDRAGLVGADGETHQGIFDLSYLSLIPHMTILAPKNKWELADELRWAIHQADGPVAIRYPRGAACDSMQDFRVPIEYGKWEVLYDESEICLLAAGSMVETAMEVRGLLRKTGYACSLVNCRFVRPLDHETLARMAQEHKLLVTLEENVETGGFGSQVLAELSERGTGAKVLVCALPDAYIEHGSVDVLKKECCIDAKSIYGRIAAQYIGL